jgi:shikimate kinase
MKLAKQGFRRFCCDDLIAARLASELTKPDGTVMEMAEWMGMPYELRYKERESQYLTCEIEVLTEILESFERGENDPMDNIVIDTTGSVVYAGEEILGRLRRYTTVVHLSTPPEVQERMLKVYVSKPRPVLWRDMFSKEPRETNEEALARCYPKLLFAREALYELHADVTIEYYRRSEEGFGVTDFLNIVDAGGA